MAPLGCKCHCLRSAVSVPFDGAVSEQAKRPHHFNANAAQTAPCPHRIIPAAEGAPVVLVDPPLHVRCNPLGHLDVAGCPEIKRVPIDTMFSSHLEFLFPTVCSTGRRSEPVNQRFGFWFPVLALGLTWLFLRLTLDASDSLILALFGVGLAATATVFWQAFRQIDRSEKQRAQVNRMRNRLNLLLKQRS